jgi:hypothetical protein
MSDRGGLRYPLVRDVSRDGRRHDASWPQLFHRGDATSHE